jgi:hypothetical protein
MNLHGVVASVIGAVNPLIAVTVRVSIGDVTAADGTRTPTYASPGAFTGTIAGTVLTVSAVASGAVQAGQTVSGAGVATGSMITQQLTGSPGGIGTYSLSRSQAVASPVAMTNALILRAQVQPVTWRDIQQMEGLNLQGTRSKIYLYGRVDGLVRSLRKGGDLVVIATGGVSDGTYLVAQVLEQYPDWCSAALTLQNE